MNLEGLGVAVVFGVPMALMAIWTGYLLWKGGRILVGNPVSVSEAAMGRGTSSFVGTARPYDGIGTFEAPFSGERALLSTYSIRENSGSSGSWTTKMSGTIVRPFLVTDSGDSILIDPTDATISPANDAVRERTGSALPNDVRLRLSQHQSDLDLENVLAQNATRSRQYIEGYVAPGDRVHIYGGELTNDPNVASTDAAKLTDIDTNIASGDGLYQITVGSQSTAAWGYIKKATLIGFVACLAAVGTTIGLATAL